MGTKVAPSYLRKSSLRKRKLISKSSYRYIYAISMIYSLYFHTVKWNLSNSWPSWTHITKRSNLLRNIQETKSSFVTRTSNATKIHCTLTCTSKRQPHTAICITHHAIPKTVQEKAHMAISCRSNATAQKALTLKNIQRTWKCIMRTELPATGLSPWRLFPFTERKSI